MPLQTDAVAVLCTANLELTLASVSKLSQPGWGFLWQLLHIPLSPHFMITHLLVINRGRISIPLGFTVKTIDINRSGIAKRGFIQQRAENMSRKRPPQSQLVQIETVTDLQQIKQGEKRQKGIKVSVFNQLRCKHSLLTALSQESLDWPGCYNRDAPHPPTSTAARAARTQRGSKAKKKNHLLCSWF